MTKQEFLAEIENMMELAPGTLKGDDLLKSYPQWDSMQVLNFIVFVQEKFDTVIEGSQVAEVSTFDDLAALVGERVIE